MISARGIDSCQFLLGRTIFTSFLCSRYFAPWVGIPEDPVTGSAHTVAGPYWAQVLGKKKLLARQCSPRGGDLTLEITEGDEGFITVSGNGTVVLEGTITVYIGCAGQLDIGWDLNS